MNGSKSLYSALAALSLSLITSCTTPIKDEGIFLLDPNPLLTDGSSNQLTKEEAVEIVKHFGGGGIVVTPNHYSATNTTSSSYVTKNEFYTEKRTTYTTTITTFGWTSVSRVGVDELRSGDSFVSVIFPLLSDNGESHNKRWNLGMFNADGESYHKITNPVSPDKFHDSTDIKDISKFLCAIKCLTKPEAWQWEPVLLKCRAIKRGLFWSHPHCLLIVNYDGVSFTDVHHPKHSFKINSTRLEGVKFDHQPLFKEDLVLLLKDGQKYSIGLWNPTVRAKAVSAIKQCVETK